MTVNHRRKIPTGISAGVFLAILYYLQQGFPDADLRSVRESFFYRTNATTAELVHSISHGSGIAAFVLNDERNNY
jgi:hypothetical protein